MTEIRVRMHIDSETLHLPELRPLIGRDVEIIVHEQAANSGASLGETPGGHRIEEDEKPIWIVAEELIANVPSKELNGLPHDGAVQHDHFIYGAPKKMI